MEDAHLLLSPQGDCRLAAVAGRRRRRVRSGGIVPPGPVDGSARLPVDMGCPNQDPMFGS
uniref:Uncharacterized protein n=1 Tax=Oryza meridionalis TaxID=40149 RepID=A0A0E0F3Z1_9ORYZ